MFIILCIVKITIIVKEGDINITTIIIPLIQEEQDENKVQGFWFGAIWLRQSGLSLVCSLQYITKIQCMNTCLKGSIGKILSAQNLLNRHQVSTAFILYFLTQSWLWAISGLEWALILKPVGQCLLIGDCFGGARPPSPTRPMRSIQNRHLWKSLPPSLNQSLYHWIVAKTKIFKYNPNIDTASALL